MKKFFFAVCLTVLAWSPAQAGSNQNLDAIAMAIVLSDIESGEIQLQEDGGIFDQIKEFIEQTKQFILESFDYNENGRIDFGEELDDTVQAFKDIILLLVDVNENGTIEREEIIRVLQDLAIVLKEQVYERICPGVIERAEAAGPWLRFRPILKALYQQCTA